MKKRLLIALGIIAVVLVVTTVAFFIVLKILSGTYIESIHYTNDIPLKYILNTYGKNEYPEKNYMELNITDETNNIGEELIAVNYEYGGRIYMNETDYIIKSYIQEEYIEEEVLMTTETGVTYHKIKDVSTEVAIAAKYPDRENYYCGVSYNYEPENLADFVKDFGLDKYSVITQIRQLIDDNSGRHEWIHFLTEDTTGIWDILLNTDTKFNYIYEGYVESRGLSIRGVADLYDMDLRISFGVTGTTIVFQIGNMSFEFSIEEAEIYKIIDYVNTEYKGYKYVR